LQAIRFGARIGHRIADDNPGILRRFVHGGDTQASGCGNGKDERPLRIDWLAGEALRLCCEKAVDRPARQPD
jgi:hypothetical protein